MPQRSGGWEVGGGSSLIGPMSHFFKAFLFINDNDHNAQPNDRTSIHVDEEFYEMFSHD